MLSPNGMGDESDKSEVYVKKLLRLTKPQYYALKSLKKHSGLNESEHMRRALDIYFEKMKSEGKM